MSASLLELDFIRVADLLQEHRWNVKAVANHLGVHPSTLYDRLQRWHFTRPPEMSKRNFNREKTHCKRGHRFHEKNLVPNKRGVRYCGACDAFRRAEAKKLRSSTNLQQKENSNELETGN